MKSHCSRFFVPMVFPILLAFAGLSSCRSTGKTSAVQEATNSSGPVSSDDLVRKILPVIF